MINTIHVHGVARIALSAPVELGGEPGLSRFWATTFKAIDRHGNYFEVICCSTFDDKPEISIESPTADQ